MNTIKKIVRWTPIVTLCMVLAMYIGMKGYNGFNGYGNDSWVARGSTTFGRNDFMSLIGHDGWKHFLSNGGTFVMYFTAIELLLVKKWKAVLVLLSMMGIYLIVEEFTIKAYALGASGWIMSIPGFLILVAAWRANKLDEDVSQKFAAMVMPFVVFGLNLLLGWEDVKGLKDSASSVSHEGHLIGVGIGIAVALVAIAIYLPRWIGQVWNEYKQERAWQQKIAVMGY